MRGDLTSVTVLVTRAPHQAGPLCELIEQANGIAVRFPVTTICEVKNQAQLESAVAHVPQADKVIFVSPNAVEFGLKVLKTYAIRIDPQTEILAVGPGTANRLREQGLPVSGIPRDRFNSEGLLKLPQLMQVEGQKVVIFRGEGGRERLHDRLVALGARVDYVECYQRSLPEKTDTRAITMWRNGEIDVVTLTSNTAADHLLQLLSSSDHDLFEKAVIATVSTRIEQYCRQLGCAGQILVSTGPGNEALVSRISDWQAQA